jgi:glutamate 5-kinase
MVIKVGSRVLCEEGGGLAEGRIQVLCDEISQLQDMGYSVVLVSSGAVGSGMDLLGYSKKPSTLAEKQACAAVGQIHLMHRYATLFGAKGKLVSQILLSAEDFRRRERFLNIRQTVSTLLHKGVLPIVNENDTVAVEEIKVGDNDKLSADVAQFLEADLLVILSDQDGLYDKHPQKYADARRLEVVPKINQEILAMAETGAGSKVSTGGMPSKLAAIRQAVNAGTPAVLKSGFRPGLIALVKGEVDGTLFLPNPAKIDRRKRWLAFVSKPRGKIWVDAGGVKALRGGRSSLLAAGIKRVSGTFQPGDVVELLNPESEAIGRGRTAYGSADLAKIKGEKSARIPEILGRLGPGEAIHRDKLAMF